MKTNYAALVIPSLLNNVNGARVVELLEALTDDTNNQIRLALYISGNLDKPSDEDFKKTIEGNEFYERINDDKDYRGRKAVFERYNFITDEVHYRIEGGELRHAFKTQEDADRWMAGEEVSGAWRVNKDYPVEAWRPAKPSTGHSCSADCWKK